MHGEHGVEHDDDSAHDGTTFDEAPGPLARIGFPLAMAAAGMLVFGLVRLVALPPAPVTHYHANFAIVVNGTPLDLSSDQYMTDVMGCRVDPTRTEPGDRAHLHGNAGQVVHVHDAGAAWGHLLANLGFGIGDDYLVTDRGARYMGIGDTTVKFVLNGAAVPSIRNRVIGPRDRLLISVGPERIDDVLHTQYPRVTADAERFDTTTDPSSCAGNSAPTIGERVRRAFWF